MNTVERIKALCKERRIAISRLERDCGFANGYIGQLRKGVLPDDRLRTIAEYLHVSPLYLSTGDDSETNELTARNDYEKRLLLSFRGAGNLTDKEMDEFEGMFNSTLDLYLKAKGLKK